MNRRSAAPFEEDAVYRPPGGGAADDVAVRGVFSPESQTASADLLEVDAYVLATTFDVVDGRLPADSKVGGYLTVRGERYEIVNTDPDDGILRLILGTS